MDRHTQKEILTNELINRQWSRTAADDLADYLLNLGYRKQECEHKKIDFFTNKFTCDLETN